MQYSVPLDIQFAKLFGNDNKLGDFLVYMFACQGYEHNSEGWIYKTHAEIRADTGITHNELLRIRKKLGDEGILTEERRARESKYTTRRLVMHYRIHWFHAAFQTIIYRGKQVQEYIQTKRAKYLSKNKLQKTNRKEFAERHQELIHSMVYELISKQVREIHKKEVIRFLQKCEQNADTPINWVTKQFDYLCRLRAELHMFEQVTFESFAKKLSQRDFQEIYERYQTQSKSQVQQNYQSYEQLLGQQKKQLLFLVNQGKRKQISNFTSVKEWRQIVRECKDLVTKAKAKHPQNEVIRSLERDIMQLIRLIQQQVNEENKQDLAFADLHPAPEAFQKAKGEELYFRLLAMVSKKVDGGKNRAFIQTWTHFKTQLIYQHYHIDHHTLVLQVPPHFEEQPRFIQLLTDIALLLDGLQVKFMVNNTQEFVQDHLRNIARLLKSAPEPLESTLQEKVFEAIINLRTVAEINDQLKTLLPKQLVQWLLEQAEKLCSAKVI